MNRMFAALLYLNFFTMVAVAGGVRNRVQNYWNRRKTKREKAYKEKLREDKENREKNIPVRGDSSTFEWLSNCTIGQVYKVASGVSGVHQEVMLRSFGNDSVCKDRLRIWFGGTVTEDLKPGFFNDFFGEHNSAVQIHTVQLQASDRKRWNNKYTDDWKKPEETKKALWDQFKCPSCLFVQHNEPGMVSFNGKGLKLTLPQLKALIHAVPLTKYVLFPSTKYMNCWKASNYIIYGFAQLQICKGRKSNFNFEDDFEECLHEISEILTRCAIRNVKEMEKEGRKKEQIKQEKVHVNYPRNSKTASTGGGAAIKYDY